MIKKFRNMYITDLKTRNLEKIEWSGTLSMWTLLRDNCKLYMPEIYGLP